MCRSLVIAIVVNLIFINFALADNYPTEVPNNFQEVQYKHICRRNTPSPIKVFIYSNKNKQFLSGNWIVWIWKRDTSDKVLRVLYFYENSNGGPMLKSKYDYIYADGRWYNLETITQEDLTEINKTFAMGNPEEAKFINNCFLEFLNNGGFMPVKIVEIM